jgi:hypothetical protein
MNRMNFFELSNSKGHSETQFFDEYFKIAEMMFDDSFMDRLLKFFVVRIAISRKPTMCFVVMADFFR